jgi:hypothetical protein
LQCLADESCEPRRQATGVEGVLGGTGELVEVDADRLGGAALEKTIAFPGCLHWAG